ncbi:MAG: hypothetical protein H6832_08270 [Planctomycetes bacterium]|nr:hypothetical protein [Planctomycetota bacterium]MCB9918383.1 hypothetical protein [Planctomycetota bacterium]
MTHATRERRTFRDGLSDGLRRCARSACAIVAAWVMTLPATAMPQGAHHGNEPACLETSASAGLQVKKADVLWGNAHRSKDPAEIDVQMAVDATPEGRRIVEEAIEKGSAQYDILMAKAQARVRRVVSQVAIAEGRDCVVRTGSYRNPDGLSVVDLTDKIVAALENGD